MSHHIFSGDHKEIGLQHGRFLSELIRANIDYLVGSTGCRDLLRRDQGFTKWVRRQESLLTANWPWLLEEVAAIAEGAGAAHVDILLLNLRAWQHNYYRGLTQNACSSLAITLRDGTVACAGALDDSANLYCGPVKIVPENGHSFITFPITGTAWGNHGMNSAGLFIGISSQILPGLRPKENAINQDLAVRVILQTCSGAGEVREFCREHPFTMNMVCVDAAGGIFCAQNTTAGMLEIPSDGWAALTNHITDDSFFDFLKAHGATDFPESPTTRPRRDKLVDFALKCTGKCSEEEILDLFSTRNDDDPASIHNYGTVYLTFADPQNNAATIGIMQPKIEDDCSGYMDYDV